MKEIESIQEHYKNKDYAKAKEEIDDLLRKKNSSGLKALLGNIYFHEGEFAKARTFYEEAIEISKDNDVALNGIGMIYHRVNDLGKAETTYKHALSIAPDNKIYNNNYGRLLLDKGDYNNAKYYFEKALNIDQSYARAYYNKGIVSLKKLEYAEAFSNLKSAYNHDDSLPYIHHLLAKTAIKLDMTQDAFNFCQKALLENKDDIDALFIIVDIMLYKHNFQDAILSLKKILRIQPNYAQALAKMGEILYKGKKFDLAKMYFDKAISLDNNLIIELSAYLEKVGIAPQEIIIPPQSQKNDNNPIKEKKITQDKSNNIALELDLQLLTPTNNKPISSIDSINEDSNKASKPDVIALSVSDIDSRTEQNNIVIDNIKEEIEEDSEKNSIQEQSPEDNVDKILKQAAEEQSTSSEKDEW